MAYMLMLVVDDPAQIDEVVAAWHKVPIEQVILLDSTCSHAKALPRHHVPMRFVFGLVEGREACTRTLFAIVPDEQAVDQCLQQTQAILGPLEDLPDAMLAAWPLPILHGYPKNKAKQGDHA